MDYEYVEFPLHFVSRLGDLEVVKHLIERGLSVDIRDGNDSTPLHKAAADGRYEVVNFLISKKCDINLKDCGGRTPVICAAERNNKDVVDLLLQSGAKVNCVDIMKSTLLHCASTNGWLDVVQRIVESGETDVDALRIYDWTPLMYAAQRGHVELVTYLIRAGADVNRSTEQKSTALHEASFFGWSKVLQVLMEVEGLDLNPQDDYGDTPLHIACSHGHPEAVEQLLIAGADINIKNCLNETAFSVGIKSGRTLTLEPIRLLVQHGAYLEDCDYVRISENPVLKELVLKDIDICTQSLINKFHQQSLPALFSNFAEKLPCIRNIKLRTQQMQDVENFVTRDIQISKNCNMVKANPIVLSMMCVGPLITYQTGKKRSVSPDFGDSSSLLKKLRHN